MPASRRFPATARILAERLRHRGARMVLAAELDGLSPEAAAYSGLAPSSLALAGIRAERGRRQVNLVLPDATPWQRFAGVETALLAAFELARLLACDLRIVETNVVARSRRHRALLTRYFDERDPAVAVAF